MRGLSLAILLLFGILPVCQAQVSDQRAQVIAKDATRAGANYPESKLLRAHRREDLEDDLFRFQIKPQGRIEKAAYFFEISGEGYFVLSPNEAVYIDSADGHLVRLVAVSAKTGQAYLLSGFKNSASEFNRLIEEAEVTITSAKDAEMFTRFYYTIVADPANARLISSSLQLKHKIEDYFFSNYPEDKAERLYLEWWSGFSANKPSFSFNALTAKSSLGYETTMIVINSSTKRTPLLDLWTFQISLNGICQIKSVRTVYPTNK